ncbi:MAG: hypothetical protein JRF56_06610, partial [Deltaproteobacteria bacterium]|nr:hypothetical protein [Deltaproteobacteria bacterium]
MKKYCGLASNLKCRVIDKIGNRGREVLSIRGRPGFSLFILILLVFIGSVPIVHGAEVPVDSIAALNAAIAAANPGDTIILANGTYPSAGTIDFNANGALGSEITVKAETPGKVVITGNPSHVYMSGSYLILSGFHFRDIDTSGNWNTLLIRLDNLIYSRITNCKIENVGQGGGSTIVGIWDNSDHNRI